MSMTPTDVTEAIHALATEVRLLREQQQRHHEAAMSAAEGEHTQRMAAAEADTEKRLAAAREDLENYVAKLGGLMEAQDGHRKSMQQEIDELRSVLDRVFTERPS